MYITLYNMACEYHIRSTMFYCSPYWAVQFIRILKYVKYNIC